MFIWGAKSGKEQLPAFPEPTHRTVNLTNRCPRKFSSVDRDSVNCRVDFLTPEHKAAAHPPVGFLSPSLLSNLPLPLFGVSAHTYNVHCCQFPMAGAMGATIVVYRSSWALCCRLQIAL